MERREATGAAASPVQAWLERLHEGFTGLREGQLASYIPELARADPGWFGVCLATVDGHVYEAGDSRRPFTIQSISKPFVYGLALEDRGHDAVLAKIGVEPTGDAFNSISLEPGTGRPLNPMINAGAIAATSLVAGRSHADRVERIRATLSLHAGRPLEIDREVYESERATGHRNRAIAHMLRNFDVIAEDPEGPLDAYFQQCSVAVDARSLAVMGATLAHGGVNPLSGEAVLRREHVESVLAVMTTCGMYDFTGEWVYWVGLPAKSGVSGGILAVLPGKLALSVFSPPLDARGNSVRGVAACRELSRSLDLHFLRAGRAPQPALRARYDLTQVTSKRARSEAEREVLRDAGQRARVYQLQGELRFPSAEGVVRAIVEASPDLDYVVLDLERLAGIDAAASSLLLDLWASLAARGKRLVVASARTHPRFVRFVEERAPAELRPELLWCEDVDLALEWCENHLLSARAPLREAERPLPLAEHALCAGLDAAALAQLERCLEHRRFAAGELIVRRGDRADHFFLLTLGEVSVTVELANERPRRLATLSPGMVFGELALVSRRERSADVRADTDVACFALASAAFDALGRTHPEIKLVLLENLLRTATQTVSRLTQEVAALSR
jgi:glutaminase